MPTVRPKSEIGGLRLLIDQPADAAWNMAVDEALLQLGEVPTLRLYGWSPHAVSLGYFQRAGDFRDLPPDTTIVRRLTGGGAIHHGDEVTFSLTLDTEILPAIVETSYRLVHTALIAACLDRGIACELATEGELQRPRPRPRPAERWCFAVPGCSDIRTNRGKLFGSAQRRVTRPRSRVLHHGSLVLRRPQLTPFVAAADDALRIDEHAIAQLHDAIASRLAAALGLTLMPGSLTADELNRANQLKTERYCNDAFTHRL